MPTSLSKEHRKLLEKTTTDARILSESACRAALEYLAVHEKEYRSHMSVEQRLLRNQLRARGRALGDKRDERSGIQDIRHLIELAAYEHWHRLLFTRFLTENHLLLTDEANGFVPVTLEECEELAPELGARDGLDLACRFASLTLPGVFRRGDPVLDLPIAINDQVELRKLLAALPSEVFLSDDALGWTYQFWQAQRKDEVNKSGKKIGADEISPVTQLFTEDYMVEFLLHNTLGAWWAGKIGPIAAATEEEARAHAALPVCDGVPAISWTYLRFVQDETTKTWLPAGGTFDGWPKAASQIRLLDPCMGSGHFLVFALPLLVRLRMEEENLNAQAAVTAVLKDNIHGLEIDERCTQIAAFNVALTAWKLAGYQSLPSLNLACSGLAPSATEAEWVALAGDNARARNGMASLHRLFKDASVLGSLINPHAQGENLFVAKFQELAPLLEMALGRETQDDIAIEIVVTAHGLAKAAEILASKFTLVATNVPYLGRRNQDGVLMDYCERLHPKAKADLATCFIERCLDFCGLGASVALVTPQYWLFLGTYKRLRSHLLSKVTWDCVNRLGVRAFETISSEIVNTAMIVLTRKFPTEGHKFVGLDVIEEKSALEKAKGIEIRPLSISLQKAQLSNPDARISDVLLQGKGLLQDHAFSTNGMHGGDFVRFRIFFWEICRLNAKWRFFQGTVEEVTPFGGRQYLFYWPENGRIHKENEKARVQGGEAWGRRGVAVSLMSSLAATLYTGELFDMACSPIVPHEPSLLPAIWAYCSSSEFNKAVRQVDQKVMVTSGTIVKISFDIVHWQKVAKEKFPYGLPKPFSIDPTQWLFNGHPKGSSQPLHVAIARLTGHQWPRQTGNSFPDCPALDPDGLESFANEDGIVCLPPLSREQPAAARLRRLLTAALGAFDERALIAAAGLKGSKSKTLEDWLRDEFFEQHAKLFHDRPFIWHIWDGRSDGFHALVNYHRLDTPPCKN